MIQGPNYDNYYNLGIIQVVAATMSQVRISIRNGTMFVTATDSYGNRVENCSGLVVTAKQQTLSFSDCQTTYTERVTIDDISAAFNGTEIPIYGFVIQPLATKAQDSVSGRQVAGIVVFILVMLLMIGGYLLLYRFVEKWLDINFWIYFLLKWLTIKFHTEHEENT